MHKKHFLKLCLLIFSVFVCFRNGRAEVLPHESFYLLPFSNGFSPVIYDKGSHKITAFYDHIYKDYDGMTPSTDLCWDTYWGLNVNGNGEWLSDVPEESAFYENGTGIVHVIRTVMGIGIDEYYFSPLDFEGSIMVMIVKVTNVSSESLQVSLFSLHNFHVGGGAPEAGFDSESVFYQDGIFIETGASTGHTFIYRPVNLPSRRRTDTSSSPGNPYFHISDAALMNNDSTGGPVDDAVSAFQWFLGSGGTMGAGTSQWEGVVITYGKNINLTDMKSKIDIWIANRNPEEILNDEVDKWHRWLESPGIIESKIVDTDRLELAKRSLIMLKMGQVRELNTGYGSPHGQIVASMPPGMWNITWPRDQSYAVVGLCLAGFFDEARMAIEFIFNGQAGNYSREVGTSDYLVSVCRYHGGGFEESDGDPSVEGPNIEFDNFGLFLWALGKYYSMSGDVSIISEHSTQIFEKTADVLVGLVEPSTHLLKPDSSIWERHWNGNQKHFAYSNIMAIIGLCNAADMAESLGFEVRKIGYMESAREIYSGIQENLIIPSDSYIAQSLEEISAGLAVDAAVVEALNFSLFPSSDTIFSNTLSIFDDRLWLNTTGHGYMRNDDGDWYDRQEWVFIDLRIASAKKIAGEDTDYDLLVDWIVNQSLANNGLIAELYDSENADYRGAVPMMGFGAGAFLLALLDDYSSESVADCLFSPMPEVEEESNEIEENIELDVFDGNENLDLSYEEEEKVDAQPEMEENIEQPNNAGGGGCGC